MSEYDLFNGNWFSTLQKRQRMKEGNEFERAHAPDSLCSRIRCRSGTVLKAIGIIFRNRINHANQQIIEYWLARVMGRVFFSSEFRPFLLTNNHAECQQWHIPVSGRVVGRVG